MLTRKPPAGAPSWGLGRCAFTAARTLLCGEKPVSAMMPSRLFGGSAGQKQPGGRGLSTGAAAARLTVPGSAGRDPSRSARAGGESLHVLGGQRVTADRPIATVHLFQHAPGHPAHVLTLDRHHRIGEFLHNLLALRAGENTLNHLDID